MNSTSGCRALIACIRPAPRMSPDDSPATSATVSGLLISADDTVRGRLNRITEQRDVGERHSVLDQLGQRGFNSQAVAVNGLVGTAQGMDGLGAETARTHAVEIHAARLGR